MPKGAVSEYKVIHGKPREVEKQLNELAPQGWQVVGVASASGGAGSLLFLIFGAAVTVILRRERGLA
jgi:hypothetical protein